MFKELQGLNIGKSPEDTADIESWYPRFHHKETKRPITKFVIGLVPTQTRYFPVEMDLTRNEPNNIIIVGGSSPFKEYFMLGIIKRASDVIGEGYLSIQAITDYNDPNQILKTGFMRKHGSKNPISSAFPEDAATGKILSSVENQLRKEKGVLKLVSIDPGILVVENLGNFVLRTFIQQEKNNNLKSILNYHGWQPHLTVATVNTEDLPYLKVNGIDPNLTPGVWLFEKMGSFHVWNRKRKKLSDIPIIPFKF